MGKWFIRIRCKFLGHKWDNGKYKQYCTREGCKVYKIVVYNRHHLIGKNAYTWKIVDFDSVKIH